MVGLTVAASAARAPSFQPSLAASRFGPVSGPTVSFRTQVCGLSCWIAAKLKLQKALKRHGWQLQRKLEVRGDDKIPDCLEVSSLTEKITPRIVRLAYESEGETANTSSDTLGSSIGCVLPSETHTPVLTEDLVLFDHFCDQPESTPSLCIAVVGATGELARSKVFPALFALYYSGFLPRNVGIFGYSRKTLTDEGLRSMIEANLTCRVDHQYVSLVAASQSLTPYFTSKYYFSQFSPDIYSF